MFPHPPCRKYHALVFEPLVYVLLHFFLKWQNVPLTVTLHTPPPH